MFTFRSFISSSVLAAAIIVLATGRAVGQSQAGKVKNVVLVHGAFADASSWAKVIPVLQRSGFNVIAVQNRLASLADDVAATRRAIASVKGPVLLVGHSWAGVVITEAGNDPQVAGLLYVCAFAPGDGQSLDDIAKTFPLAPGNTEVRLDAAGYLSLSVKGISDHFAQDLSAADKKVIYATQGEWAAGCTVDKIDQAAWKSRPSWFLIGTNDHMINPALQRAEAKLMKATSMELSSSHVPMLSHPKKVAEFIISAAGSL